MPTVACDPRAFTRRAVWGRFRQQDSPRQPVFEAEVDFVGRKAADFAQQPQVINGFSELMRDVFGAENGIGARSALGTNTLPGNIAVEIELIIEIKG